MTTEFKILPFDIKGASRDQYIALNRHINILRHERLPDDPPVALDETINELQNLPPFIDLPMWCAWDEAGEQIIAEGYMQILRTGENEHLSEIQLMVRPEYRLRGLGRRLLGLMADKAAAEKRRLLVTQTYDRIPAGEAFMARLGGERGMEAHVNQLRIADLDHGLLESWLTMGEALGSEFDLGLWEGLYPDDQLEAIASLYDLTNQQPFGTLEIEDMHMTPEQLRQIDQLISARGGKRWTYYIKERSTGRFVGYTETVWTANRPEVLSQEMTGVFPEFRGRGLGRWMKAAMLDKVLRERPQVKYIRTGNADSNAAMLKINNELGFTPYMASCLWQVSLERVQDYLNQSVT